MPNMQTGNSRITINGEQPCNYAYTLSLSAYDVALPSGTYQPLIMHTEVFAACLTSHDAWQVQG